MAYAAVSVATTATVIIAANNRRKGFVVNNNSTVTVFIGEDASITTSNAIPILADGNYTDSGLDAVWKGVVYGIVATGTANTRYWEWNE